MFSWSFENPEGLAQSRLNSSGCIITLHTHTHTHANTHTITHTITHTHTPVFSSPATLPPGCMLDLKMVSVCVRGGRRHGDLYVIL